MIGERDKYILLICKTFEIFTGGGHLQYKEGSVFSFQIQMCTCKPVYIEGDPPPMKISNVLQIRSIYLSLSPIIINVKINTLRTLFVYSIQRTILIN